MYKTLGEYSWRGILIQSSEQCPANKILSTNPLVEDKAKTTPFAGDIHYTLENLKLVS